MSPDLKSETFVFLTAPGFTPEEQVKSTMVFREAEGVTLVIPQHLAGEWYKPYENKWAMITLQIHSDLNAIGFLAAITAKLAAAGISVNAVSAYYHDHLFVPWDKKDLAMKILKSFAV